MRASGTERTTVTPSQLSIEQNTHTEAHTVSTGRRKSEPSSPPPLSLFVSPSLSTEKRKKHSLSLLFAENPLVAHTEGKCMERPVPAFTAVGAEFGPWAPPPRVVFLLV